MKERKIGEFSLLVFDEVYDPADDSFLLAENLAVKPGDIVLDVGSGTGLITLVAIAKGARRVVAIDVSPLAARNTLANVDKNGCKDKVDVVVGDTITLLKPGVFFNVVAFNPPYLPVNDEGKLGLAWSGGKTGRKVISRFIRMAKKLHPRTMFQIILSSVTQPEKVLRLLSHLGFKYRIDARRKFFFEELVLISFSR